MDNFTNVEGTTGGGSKVDSAREARVARLRSLIKNLGITTSVLAVVLIIGGIPEVAIKPCRSIGLLNLKICGTYSKGQAIWASLLPLTSGIFGIIVGSKSFTQLNVGLFMLFSILGALSSSVLVILQLIYAFATKDAFGASEPVFYIQLVISIVAFVNLVLLIVSSCYSCQLCNGCCGDTSNSATTKVVYVTQNASQMESAPFVQQQQTTNPANEQKYDSVDIKTPT